MADRALHIGVDARELAGQPTGVGRYLGQVLGAWRVAPAFRHRVTAFLPVEPSQTLRDAYPHIAWVVEEGGGHGTRWEQTRLPRALARAAVDVFFAAGYTAPVRTPCPFVVAIYDVSFFAHPEWFGWREGLRRRWLTRRAARAARSIITISEFSAGEIVRWIGVDRPRIHLAPPGAPPASRLANGVRRQPLVLFVGSLFTRRHIPDLIRGFAQAAARVPGARLVLVGDNRTHPRIDPGTLAASMGVGDRVDWLEYVDDTELERLYADARVFAFLSDYEGFAMTPMEALAHGVPAVLLDTAVAHEVYGDGAWYVNASDEAIGDALSALLVDDAAHGAVLTAGRDRLSRFSWARTADVVRYTLEEAASS